MKLQCSQNKTVLKKYLQLGVLSCNNYSARTEDMTTQVRNPYVKPWGLHEFGNFLDFRKVMQYTHSILYEHPSGPSDTWSLHKLLFLQ